MLPQPHTPRKEASKREREKNPETSSAHLRRERACPLSFVCVEEEALNASTPSKQETQETERERRGPHVREADLDSHAGYWQLRAWKATAQTKEGRKKRSGKRESERLKTILFPIHSRPRAIRR